MKRYMLLIFFIVSIFAIFGNVYGATIGGISGETPFLELFETGTDSENHKDYYGISNSYATMVWTLKFYTATLNGEKAYCLNPGLNASSSLNYIETKKEDLSKDELIWYAAIYQASFAGKLGDDTKFDTAKGYVNTLTADDEYIIKQLLMWSYSKNKNLGIGYYPGKGGWAIIDDIVLKDIMVAVYKIHFWPDLNEDKYTYNYWKKSCKLSNNENFKNYIKNKLYESYSDIVSRFGDNVDQIGITKWEVSSSITGGTGSKEYQDFISVKIPESPSPIPTPTPSVAKDYYKVIVVTDSTYEVKVDQELTGSIKLNSNDYIPER